MKRNLLITVAATLAGASALVLAAQAAETEYKFTWCGLDRSAMLTSGPDLTIFTDEARGMVTPESGFKPFENTAVRCMGYHRMMQGKEWGHSACLMTDAQGDTLIGEATIAPEQAAGLDVPGWHGQVAGDHRERDVSVHRHGQAGRRRNGGVLPDADREVHAAEIGA